MDRSFARTMLENAGLKVELDRPLSKLTTYRTGGPADLFVSVRSVDELRMACATARAAGASWFVIGCGSNLLAPDEGFRGVLVRLAGGLASVSFRGDRLVAGAGARLGTACGAAAREGLTGLEFASGIPGSVGGGLYMNAGAWGGSLGEKAVVVTVLDTEHNEVRTEHGPFNAGYRKSPWQKKALVILSAEFDLVRDEPERILERMKEFTIRRKRIQPVSKPSAGSVFRNPESGLKAWELIDSAGLRGTRQGGAMVSRKHSNFIVNESGATSSDILSLIARVTEEVRKKTGVSLDTEIEILGGDAS